MITLEKELISALKGLIHRVKIKTEHLQILETALGESKLYGRTFKTIIDGKNAKIALEENIYTQEMIRLLTLRSIIFPDTLPQWLTWMEKRNTQSYEHYLVSLNFQKEILTFISHNNQKYTHIKRKIFQGLAIIIPNLITHPEKLELVLWLLKSPKMGIWANIYHQEFQYHLDYELRLMEDYHGKKIGDSNLKLMKMKVWIKIRDDIGIFLRFSNCLPLEKYYVLALLFTELDNIYLAVFFYQISLGEVPTKLFDNFARLYAYNFSIDFNQKYQFDDQIKVYGIKLKRQINKSEKKWMIIIFISLILGSLGVYLMWETLQQCRVRINNVELRMPKIECR